MKMIVEIKIIKRTKEFNSWWNFCKTQNQPFIILKGKTFYYNTSPCNHNLTDFAVDKIDFIIKNYAKKGTVLYLIKRQYGFLYPISLDSMELLWEQLKPIFTEKSNWTKII